MRWIGVLVVIVVLLFNPSRVFAESDYVLPYPPVMPGGIMYKLRLLHEEIQKYWYFGTISQFTYNLKQSDRYLVQSKTLFEYKQYLLAYKALENSTKYFSDTYPFLLSAKIEGKNVSEKEEIYKNAARKHIEILEMLSTKVPKEFIWEPENESPVTLQIHTLIESAIKARKDRL